ncbi:MAG: sulfotransferase, partial [Steroidobacteraceae bacterium]
MSTFRPVFIGGAGRSGTTLVVDLLGTHANLSPVYETNFVLGVARELLAERPLPESAAAIRQLMHQWTEPLPQRPHHKRPHERYLHGPHYILFGRDYALNATETLIDELATDPIAGYRRFIGSLFARHAELDGKPFWVNKTPTYVAVLPFLKQVWPELLFIHCVRDGRDVAASVLTRPWGPSTWAEAGSWWRDQVQPGLKFAE